MSHAVAAVAGMTLRDRQGDEPVSVSEGIDPAEWDAYVATHPQGAVDHLWRWREIFRSVFGHDSTYLVARRGDSVSGVLPLVRFHSRLFGRSLVSVPFLNYGGVLASDDGSALALVDGARAIARDFGASHVELRHTTRQLPELPCRQHKLMLTRRLPQSVEALWAGIDKKVRNQVRKAQKDGLTAETGGAELVDAFYGVFARNMRDLGTPVYTKRLFSETLRLFPEARVYVVRKGSEPVAVSIAIRYRDTVLVPWASSLREFRQHCPNMLLYWTMVESATTAGAGIFDFGRSSPGSGTHQFKVQWGATAEPLHWEYVLLTRDTAPDQGPSNPRFQAVVELWKKMPLGVANVVGPLIVRNIP